MPRRLQTVRAELSILSQAAQLALDYIVRHQASKGDSLCVQDLARSLRGAYPLFRYLFPDVAVCESAIEELRRASWLQGSLPVGKKWKARLRRIVVECIRFKAREILDRMPLRDISEVAESAVIDHNVASLNEDLKFLNCSPLNVAAPLSKQYSKALLEVGSDEEKRELLKQVASMAGMSPLELTSTTDANSLPTGLFESKDFIPDCLFKTTFAVVDYHGDYDLNLQAAVRLEEDRGNVVFLLINEMEAIPTWLAEICKSSYAVLIREEDLKRMALSKDRSEAMRAIVFPQFRPSKLSPFKYLGPVTRERFVGRRAEIQRILSSASGNFVVLGARTIGKSSLLMTMRDRLTVGPERGRAIPVFVDATQNHHLRHFQKNLMQTILKDTEQSGIQIDWIDPAEDFFEDLAEVLRKSGKKYLFLIDEVDNLLKDAKINQFEEFVRSMSNIGCVRFVISGYRNLREHIEDRESFFFNLFEPIILSPLSRGDADELVRKQMRRIYVEFENDQVIESVLDLGST